MLELRSVDFYYQSHTKVLSSISLSIQQGEFLVIAGRNGSGKTTLTRLLMALKKPVGGDILFQGKNIQPCTPADMARHIGYVFQNPDRQIFHDTVFSEVSYGPEQLGYSSDDVTAFVHQALTATDLDDVADTSPAILSRGQKQRLAIASAMAMQPKILILDEPTSGQDAKQRQQLLAVLKDLHQQGKTIILITHDMDILAAYAQRVIVMSGGFKVFDGTSEQLFTHDELERWGLSRPTALTISQALSPYGIQTTAAIQPLIQSLSLHLGGRKPCKCSHP